MPTATKFRVYGSYVSLAPQTAQILQHLKNVGEISGVEAIAMYKARSLTKRISEINEALYGYVDTADLGGPLKIDVVQSEWKRDTTGQRYKRYFMSAKVRAYVNTIRANVVALVA